MTRGAALIPARGGSLRIPGKNARSFLGVPAIQRAIWTVHEAGIVGRIVVSTDDEEIARLAEDAGADASERRPAEFADDHATTLSVIRHAVEAWLDPNTHDEPLWVVYPTAMLLTPAVLRAADERYRALAPEFLFSVLRYPHPVERRLRMNPAGRVGLVHPEHDGTRTQDLTPTFYDAGQFYVASASAWRLSAPMVSNDAVGFELPRGSVVDIDEPDDWIYAENLAALRKEPFEMSTD